MYLHSILIIIVCIPSILPVISFGGKSANHREEISIFSFNAKFFRKRNTYEKFSERTISAVVQQDSDIKCIQEFSTNSKWKVLDVTSRIRSQGYYSYIFKAEVPESDHNPGLAIFSKFPIVTSGIVWQEPGIHHAGIFTDIKIREDTIRVYNVHFASLLFRVRQITLEDKIESFSKRLQSAALIREKRTSSLIDHSKLSPYPVIIVGDFNETPYSYNFRTIGRELNNLFSKVGRGIAYTYSAFPILLKIDHQFYDPGIDATRTVIDKIHTDSDHYPIIGYYTLDRK